MPFYRRRLPHWIPRNATVFVTWRLAGSVPAAVAQADGANFITRDDDWDRADTGPLWLNDRGIAVMVRDALHYGQNIRQMYALEAWVIMPNHVHLLLEPNLQLPLITRWLKGRTARVANRILGRTGQPFWQDESFDHWVRSPGEFRDILRYIERNPVKAGLAEAEQDWHWSSAHRPPES